MIRGSRVIAQIWTYLTFIPGSVFVVLGVIVLLNDSLEVVINLLSGVQAFWVLAVASNMPVMGGKAAKTSTQRSEHPYQYKRPGDAHAEVRHAV